MATAWATIEDALRTWVKTATGYADSQVIWAEQNGARPGGSIIVLRLGEVRALGATDELQEITDLGRPAGQEVEERVCGMREFAVSLQAYGDAVTGTSAARAVLTKCQTALGLPSVRAALETAGCTAFDIGPVTNVTLLNNTKFEGRGLLEVRFYARDTVSEYVGYIETIEAESFMGPPESGTAGEIDI